MSLLRSLASAAGSLPSVPNYWGNLQDTPRNSQINVFCDGPCLNGNVNPSTFSSEYRDIVRITSEATTAPVGMMRGFDGRWFGYTLGSIVLICSISLLLWTLRYRKARVVRASQPIFLLLILAGSMFFGTTLIPLSRESCEYDEPFGPCDRACVAAPWFSILGWTMLFSGIYAKLRRVRIAVEHAQRFRRVTISYWDVLRPFILLFSFNFTALLTSTIFFPLKWEIVQVEDPNEPYYYGTCNFKAGVKVGAIQWGQPEQWGSVVFAILSIGNIAALILALVEAFRGRNIIVEYNESRFILMAALCILQIMLVGLPVLILVQEQYNKTLSYFFACTIIFSTSMSVLLFLFMPKVWAHHTQKETATNTMTAGLSIQKRFGTSTVLQAQLNTFKAKLDHLQSLLQADGIDAPRYFEQVGLRTTTIAMDAESGNSSDSSGVPVTAVQTCGLPLDMQSPVIDIPNDIDQEQDEQLVQLYSDAPLDASNPYIK